MTEWKSYQTQLAEVRRQLDDIEAMPAVNGDPEECRAKIADLRRRERKLMPLAAKEAEDAAYTRKMCGGSLTGL